jgi:hypothetical protein
MKVEAHTQLSWYSWFMVRFTILNSAAIIFIAAIIGRTCSFDAKKSSLQAGLGVVSCYAKSSKNFFKNSDFPLQLPALLVQFTRLST